MMHSCLRFLCTVLICVPKKHWQDGLICDEFRFDRPIDEGWRRWIHSVMRAVCVMAVGPSIDSFAIRRHPLPYRGTCHTRIVIFFFVVCVCVATIHQLTQLSTEAWHVLFNGAHVFLLFSFVYRQVTGCGLAQEHLATRFLFQERQTSHFPDHDYPQSLLMALPGQENPLRRQVSYHWTLHDERWWRMFGVAT